VFWVKNWVENAVFELKKPVALFFSVTTVAGNWQYK